MDYAQLPVVLRTSNSRNLKILPRNAPRTKEKDAIYVGYVAFPIKGQTAALVLLQFRLKPVQKPKPVTCHNRADPR